MEPDSPYQSPSTFEPPPYLTRRSNLTLTTKQILVSFDGPVTVRFYGTDGTDGHTSKAVAEWRFHFPS